MKKDARFRCWFLEVNKKSLDALVAKGRIQGEALLDPAKLAEQLQKAWEGSGEGRTAAVAVCESAGGLFHAHAALYNEKSAISRSVVSNFFGKAHADPQRGSKEDVAAYLQKTGKFEEKGEKVLATIGLEKIQDGRRKRPPKNEAAEKPMWAVWKDLIDAGIPIPQIVEEYPTAIPHMRNLENYVELLHKAKFENVKRTIHVTYVWGKTRTGKSTSVYDRHGYAAVYVVRDGDMPFDQYKYQPVVLFEEFRSGVPYMEMLRYLDGFPMTLRARYHDRTACYTEVYMVSNWPLERQYEDLKTSDAASYRAFLARINTVEMHVGSDAVDVLQKIIDWHTAHKGSLPSSAERWFKAIDFALGVIYYESVRLYLSRDKNGIPTDFPDDDVVVVPAPPEYGF